MSLREIDIEQAVESLAEYARRAGEGPVVVTADGKPVAVVLAVDDADLETLSLGTSPRFLALIERSRARRLEEGGISSEEMRRRLGSAPKRKRKSA